MKLCKDCKYYRFEKPMKHWCLYDYLSEHNKSLITGKPKGAWSDCYSMRYGANELCGVGAKLFEQKRRWGDFFGWST